MFEPNQRGKVNNSLAVDSIVVPLLSQQHHLQQALTICQKTMRKGGWFLCNALVNGSFEGVQAVGHAKNIQLVSVPDMIADLSQVGLQQPIIDCSRFALHYNNSSQVIADYQQLVPMPHQEAPQWAGDTVSAQGGPIVSIEIAHLAVFISETVRESMMALPIPVRASTKSM